MQGRLLELVRQQAEARDVGGPAPAAVFKAEERDAQRIARLGAIDLDRTERGIDAPEIQPRQIGRFPVRRDLAAGRIQARELQHIARGRLGDRRERVVPADMMLVAVDGVNRPVRMVVAHHVTSCA